MNSAILPCEPGGMPFANGFATRMESAAVIGRERSAQDSWDDACTVQRADFGLVGLEIN